MASTYLTSENMELIERLLAEVRPKTGGGAPPTVTVEARLLIAAFEAGTKTKDDLRRLLDEHITRANLVTG